MKKFTRSAKLPQGAYAKSFGEAISPYAKGGQTLEWRRLKQNECPKCKKTWGDNEFTKEVGYVSCSCGFRISIRRLSEIVNSQVTKGLEEKWNREQEES